MSKTIAEIRKLKAERAEAADRVKVDWFRLTKPEAKQGDKYSRRLVFLQELDEDSPKFEKSRGAALYLQEHTSPYDFTRRAECSMDAEGKCLACDMNQLQPVLKVKKSDGKTEEKKYPWRASTNMYINVYTDEGKVEVLSRSAPGAVFDFLDQQAQEELDGGITGVTWKINKGLKLNDAWQLSTTKVALDVPDDVELFDLQNTVARKVKYEDQKKFYLIPDKDEVDEEESTSEKKSDETEW